MDNLSKQTLLERRVVKCHGCKIFLRFRKSPYGEMVEKHVCEHCLHRQATFEDCVRFVRASQLEAEQEALRRL